MYSFELDGKNFYCINTSHGVQFVEPNSTTRTSLGDLPEDLIFKGFQESLDVDTIIYTTLQKKEMPSHPPPNRYRVWCGYTQRYRELDTVSWKFKRYGQAVEVKGPSLPPAISTTDKDDLDWGASSNRADIVTSLVSDDRSLIEPTQSRHWYIRNIARQLRKSDHSSPLTFTSETISALSSRLTKTLRGKWWHLIPVRPDVFARIKTSLQSYGREILIQEEEMWELTNKSEISNFLQRAYKHRFAIYILPSYNPSQINASAEFLQLLAATLAAPVSISNVISMYKICFDLSNMYSY